ncbi:MAG: zinc ABC transporter substrate-binding protein [Desulfobacteraceae bacterium]|nr:zinc ABC transporter substrate-binding protein [Desulfobacteraceae bacterium]
MKKIITVMAGILIMAVGTRAVHAQDDGKDGKRVLTSLQATYSLTARLCRGTALRVEHLYPRGVSMKSQQHYIKTHGNRLGERLGQATAVVSIRSAWPGDPLFPAARGKNIGVIEIDAAMPFDCRQSGVALLDAPVNGGGHGGKSCLKLWLSLANASRMADIIAADLQRLSPGDRGVIGQNLMDLKQEIFKLRSGYESRFASLDSLEAIAMTGEFIYLTDNFNIEVVDYFLKPEIDWTAEDLAAFKQAILDNDIKVVIHKWEPDKAIMDVLREIGARLVVLDAMDPAAGNGDGITVDAYLETMKQNLAALAAAL